MICLKSRVALVLAEKGKSMKCQQQQGNALVTLVAVYLAT